MRCTSLEIRTLLPLVASVAVIGPAFPSAAIDLTSASYRLRGLHPAAFGPANLQRTAPTTTAGSGASLGQGDALGPFGSPTTLTSLLPGIWPIAARALPSLDLDHDQRPWFLDDDDDGDGLLDVAETNTGLFVSSSDTGTSPVDPDSDHDGHPDGEEVANGTNPNDPNSPPPPPPSVPALPATGRILLVLALIASICRRTGHGRQHV